MTISALSGYRIMWIYVMFDLPVGTDNERKSATKFRQNLLNWGFDMAQFSVYCRFCAGGEKIDVMSNKIIQNLPSGGKVDILTITDRQYENIIHFAGRAQKSAKKRKQLILT